MKKVAVVILNYNGEKFLKQFLPSVISHSPLAEIIVADNASKDQSILFSKRCFLVFD
jgi:glycosyltransferase involved in cell wall biosynthesis